MDLISIRRKYRNIRNIIFGAFLFLFIVVFIILMREIYKEIVSEKFYVSYTNLYNEILLKQQEELEQQKAEAERIRQERLPNLTDQGKENVVNIYHSDTKRVFLTFDDGPSKVTPQILDTLKQENVKATFFLLGSRVELYPDLVKREYEEGHYLASHGYSHVYSQIYSSPQAVLDEYNASVTAIRNAIGEQEYNPHLFRFPGGYKGGKYASIKQEADKLLELNGIVHVDWNSITADAAGNTTTEEFLAELDKTAPKHNSVVVLMHDAGNKQATADALPQIIAYFRDRGYTFENFYSIIK